MDEKRRAYNERQRRRRRRQREYQRRAILALFAVSLALAVVLLISVFLKNKDQDGKKTRETVETTAEAGNKESVKKEKKETDVKAQYQKLLKKAENLAAGYDYDAAIEALKSYKGYGEDSAMQQAAAKYEEAKAACVPVNVQEITHIFYHSLVVDPDRAFANQDTDHQAAGNNQWMTTVDEFNKITQKMYDEGYVLVNLHDIAAQTTDENGAVHFKPGSILLPPGKKAYVLSIDDLSYYHCYAGYGFASKMVLDEKGKPKCEYIQADGSTVVGDYDVVPLLDAFLEEHPDGAYRGARGIIALTGYNGVLGYRTDLTYQTVPEDINQDKKKWLEEHPDFDLEKERAAAKEVADAMKKDGWSFASHTWGHLKVGSISLERLQADTQKWKESVEPVVGSTDAIIFAHGEDLDGWPNYDTAAGKYQYLKSQGYNFFCNVDSTQYGVNIQDGYVRQTRRNLDGYRIYQNAVGAENNLADLFNAAEIIDPKRPPVLPLG